MTTVELKRVIHVHKFSAAHRHLQKALLYRGANARASGINMRIFAHDQHKYADVSGLIITYQRTWTCHCYLTPVCWSFSWTNHHLIRSTRGSYEHANDHSMTTDGKVCLNCFNTWFTPLISRLILFSTILCITLLVSRFSS